MRLSDRNPVALAEVAWGIVNGSDLLERGNRFMLKRTYCLTDRHPPVSDQYR